MYNSFLTETIHIIGFVDSQNADWTVNKYLNLLVVPSDPSNIIIRREKKNREEK